MMPTMIYGAFVISALSIYPLREWSHVGGCWGVTLWLGFMTVISLKKQFAQYKKEQAIWQEKPASPASANPGSSWIEPMSGTLLRDTAGIAERLAHTVPDWLHTASMRDEWHKQDVLAATASYYAEVGGITDEYVRQSIGEIQQMPHAYQYDAFEVLYTQVINGHDRGMMASVLDEVNRAQDKSMGF
jgi:hypothetical protein